MKRANGQGSLRYDKTRKRYELRITVDGARRKVVGKTQAEVTERAEHLRRSLALGPGLPAEMTTGRFLTYWLTDVLPGSDIAQSTADGYERIVRLYVIPAVGRVRLDQLTPAHVRKMLTGLREQGLSPNTQRLARSVLRRALRTAEAEGYVTRNVAALVDGVKLGRPDGRTLTPDQARALLSRVQGTEWDALVVVLLSLGLRKGEALALSWTDLDLDGTPPTLTVRRSLKKAADGSVYADEPKTTGSRRTIHLPAPTVDVLRQHRARQAEQRLAFGAGWGGSWTTLDLVFTTSVGTPLDPDRVNRVVKRITDDTGLGTWTPHELRHSAASLLLAQGVPLKVVSEMLGHASIRITADVYGHLLEPARTEAADAMAVALWG
jgi:integrase